MSSMFVERPEVLEAIWSKLDTAGIVKGIRVLILHGMRGSGKTQMCIKIFAEYSDRFEERLWISADTRSSLEQSLLSFARSKSLETVEHTAVISTGRYLAGLKKPWLLVLDNAAEDSEVIQLMRMLIPYEDKQLDCRGAVLITSNFRHPRLLSNSALMSVYHLPIPKLDPQTAIAILKKGIGEREFSEEETWFAQVVQSLHLSPLAISIAAALIGDSNDTVESFARKVAKEPQHFLNDQKVDESNEYRKKITIYGLLEESVATIEKKMAVEVDDAVRKTVRDVLRLLSFFNSNAIPWRMLRDAETGDTQWEWACTHGADMIQHWDWNFLETVLGALANYQLLDIQGEGPARQLWMHSLIHEWSQECLFDGQPKERWRLTALSLIASSVKEPDSLFKTKRQRDFQAGLLPHLESCTASREFEDLLLTPPTTTFLLDPRVPLSRIRTMVFRHSRTETSQKDSNFVTPDAKLAILYQLIAVYQENLKAKESLRLSKLLLSHRILSLPNGDDLITEAQSQVAKSLELLGKYSQAIEMRKLVVNRIKAKKIRNQANQDAFDFPLFQAQQRLALAYGAMSLWDKAAEGEEELFQMLERSDLPKDRQKFFLLSSERKLAQQYFRLCATDPHGGQTYTLIWERLLRVWRELLECEDENVGTWLRNIGTAKYPYPEFAIKEVLSIIGGLAQSSSRKGLKEQALEYRAAVFHKAEEVWSRTSRQFLTCKDSLGVSYLSSDKLEDAKQILEEVWQERVTLLGDNHPDTLISKLHMAQWCRKSGDTSKAIKMLEDCRQHQIDSLGPTHKDTIETSAELGRAYFSQRNAQAALLLQRETWEFLMSDSRHGKTHFLTFNASDELACTYRTTGQQFPAITLWIWLCEAQDQYLGKIDRYSLRSWLELARTLVNEDNQRAEEIYRENLRRTIDRPELHEDYALPCLAEFRRLLLRLGNVDEASSMFETEVQIARQIYPEKDCQLKEEEIHQSFAEQKKDIEQIDALAEKANKAELDDGLANDLVAQDIRRIIEKETEENAQQLEAEQIYDPLIMWLTGF